MHIEGIMTRVYLTPTQFESSISFYERLLEQPCQMRFAFAAAGLEIATVGSLLLIAGSKETLQRFRTVTMTVAVSSLRESLDILLSEGAVVIEGPQPVPSGLNMHIRYPDGTLAEYVQLIPEQAAASNLVRNQEA